jgi:hypothetical protein
VWGVVIRDLLMGQVALLRAELVWKDEGLAASDRKGESRRMGHTLAPAPQSVAHPIFDPCLTSPLASRLLVRNINLYYLYVSKSRRALQWVRKRKSPRSQRRAM